MPSREVSFWTLRAGGCDLETLERSWRYPPKVAKDQILVFLVNELDPYDRLLLRRERAIKDLNVGGNKGEDSKPHKANVNLMGDPVTVSRDGGQLSLLCFRVRFLGSRPRLRLESPFSLKFVS